MLTIDLDDLGYLLDLPFSYNAQTYNLKRLREAGYCFYDDVDERWELTPEGHRFLERVVHLVNEDLSR